MTALVEEPTAELAPRKRTYVKRNMKSNTLMYFRWHSMLNRCENPSHAAYKNYGARGITVCEEWHDYAQFLKWAEGSGYVDGLTLDRVDNDKGYSPENCRWATEKEQRQNTRANVWLEHNGERLIKSEWARRAGISHELLDWRLSQGWPMERVLSPAAEAQRYECYGEYLTVEEMAPRLGMHPTTIKWRLRHGWSIARIITTPVGDKKTRRAS